MCLLRGRGGRGRGGLVCHEGSLHIGRRKGGSTGTDGEKRREKAWRKAAEETEERRRSADTQSKPHEKNAEFHRHLENEKQRELRWASQSFGWGQITLTYLKVWLCSKVFFKHNWKWMQLVVYYLLLPQLNWNALLWNKGKFSEIVIYKLKKQKATTKGCLNW